MKVFVTGASGFIGAAVTRALVALGHDVYAMLREGSDASRLGDAAERLHVVRGDLLDLANLSPALSEIRPELCIHHAWYAAPGHYLVADENISHLAAALSLARGLADVGCHRFVGVGTCLEYDTTARFLDESTPTRATSLYAACKLSAFEVLTQMAALAKFEFCWLRFFYQYGPTEDRRRLVPSIVLPLLRGEPARFNAGEHVRDFLYIDDLASAVCAAALSDLVGPVNVGSGEPTTVRTVIETIGEICGRPDLLELGVLPYRREDPPFVCAKTDKLREATGWAPQYNLWTGLAATVNWWQNQTESRLVAPGARLPDSIGVSRG